MIREKSCGAVIWNDGAGERRYLVERMVKGHTSLCKGHVEGRETEHETAAREIMEETGLQVVFRSGFREIISYSPYPGCIKKVVFFLAEASGTDVVAQPEEVDHILWLPLEQALDALTHESDRNVLRKADAWLKRKERQNGGSAPDVDGIE